MCNAVKLGDDLLRVDLIRIIRCSILIKGGFALLVLFAGDIIQEFVIAGKAAAILRRASPLPAEKLRIERSSFRSLQFLNNNAMLQTA